MQNDWDSGINGYTMPLSDKLVSMRLSSLFGGDVDLSGITGRRELYVSSVQHKALVDFSVRVYHTRALPTLKICESRLSWIGNILHA